MNRFLELIKKNKGFEITLGFRENEDIILGGIENKVWFYKEKGSKIEYWIGSLENNKWSDKHYIQKGKELSFENDDNESTIKKIIQYLYIGQEQIEKENRKPTEVEKYGMKVNHYVFNFGEVAYDISEEYGVTVSYSNINDEMAGFMTRRVTIGKDVKPPKEA